MFRLALLMSAFSFVFVGCSGGGSSKGQDPGPSIRAAYADKMKVVFQLLDYSSKASNYDSNSHQFLSAQIDAVKDIVPEAGFDVLKQVDSFSLMGDLKQGWEFKDGFAIRISKISIWFLNDTSVNLENATFQCGGYYTHGKALVPQAYVPESVDFDFASHTPQFVMEKPGVAAGCNAMLVKINGGIGSPYQPRVLVDYATFNERTLATINKWRSFLDEIDAELNDLQYKSSKNKNYPTTQKLNEIYQKLSDGYNALP